MGLAKDAVCCCCVLVMAFFIGLTVFAVKTACVVSFLTSVDEASLAHLSLAAPAGNNGTPPPAAPSLSYDLALVVALRWYDRRAVGFFNRAAPLEAELRFLGRPLARASLAGAEWAATGDVSEMLYRLAWHGEINATMLALWPGAASAFVRESAAGVFDLELVVAGEFKSTVLFRSRWCVLRVSCPLRLSVSKSVGPAPFARVECAS